MNVTEMSDGGHRFTRSGRPSADEKHDYRRRQLLAAPYNADFWTEMAKPLTWVYPDFTAHRAASISGMEVNAIVYSNHSKRPIFRFLSRKLREIGQLEVLKAEYGPSSQKGFNLEKDYFCPVIRSSRLLEYIRSFDGSESSYAETPPEMQAQISEIDKYAEVGGYCKWERTAPVEAIFYEPVEVDLSLIN